MSGGGLKGLEPGRRAKALDLARALSKTGTPSVSPAKSGPRKRVAKAPSFTDLPGYHEMSLQRAVAEHTKIDVPFFRAHDRRAGATTIIDGQEMLNFASYDYLGLNGHPDVHQAAREAIDKYGISASASRVVAGERPIHRELERALADLHGAEDAVVFVSGHATNVSAIGQILQKNDLLLHDALIHNSIVTGGLLSGAARQIFSHNDYDGLEEILQTRAGQHDRILIAVEGVYSMDGDCPDLQRLVEIKQRYGCWLMVDEAHSMGTMGATGRGLAEHGGVDPTDVDIWMGTLSKTFAGCGGYIAGVSALTEYLKFSAAGFVYSVGLPPLIAASVKQAITAMLNEPERVERCQRNGKYLVNRAVEAGLDVGVSQGYAVVPIMTGDSMKAALLSDFLFKRGINALPIIFPAVPEKSARLRLFVTSEHNQEQLDTVVKVICEEMERAEQFRLAL